MLKLQLAQVDNYYDPGAWADLLVTQTNPIKLLRHARSSDAKRIAGNRLRHQRQTSERQFKPELDNSRISGAGNPSQA